MSESYVLGRRSIASGRRGRAISPVPFVLEEEDDVVKTPFTPGPKAAAGRRGRIGTPRCRRSSKPTVLPSWYPRKPLTGLRRRCPPSYNLGNIPKILLSATKKQTHSPQKKLLENIEFVEKLVMEELRRLRTTSSAKKAFREKRVRTLMSMR